VRREKPDLAILDLGMPDISGFEVIRLFRHLAPNTKMLVLTMHDDEDMIRQSFNLGAHGFVLKSEAIPDVLEPVEHLRNDGAFFISKILRSRPTQDGHLPEAQCGPNRRLTERERDIVRQLASGKTNKEVAASLQISVRTVESHRSHVMRKLKLENYSRLVRFAVRNGLVNP